MSDRALSSDEDEPKKIPQSKGTTVRGRPLGDLAPIAPQEALSSSSDEMLTEEQKVSRCWSKSIRGVFFQGKVKLGQNIFNIFVIERHFVKQYRFRHFFTTGILVKYQSVWKETTFINFAILIGVAKYKNIACANALLNLLKLF